MSYVDLAILSNVPKIIWIKRSYYYDKIIIFIMMIGMIGDIVEKSSFGVCSSIAAPEYVYTLSILRSLLWVPL
jgi:hypothetical protein